MIKQLTFRGRNEGGQVFCEPLTFDSAFEKNAAERSKLHPKVQDFVRAVRPTKKGIYVLVSALGAGEYWGSNVNGDYFPEKALVHSPADWGDLSTHEMRTQGKTWAYGYPTFMNAYPYKHHVNKDPSRAFGHVELAVWNPKMHRVELVVYLDRVLCRKFGAEDIIDRIENGEFPDVSMGCKVPDDICMICEHRSKTRKDYCQHAATMMNKILPDGRKVAVRNDFPRFFDISFVFIGADKTAKVMAKLAQVGNQICLGEFCTIPRPSAEIGEMFSKEAEFSMEPGVQTELQSPVDSLALSDDWQARMKRRVARKNERLHPGELEKNAGAMRGLLGLFSALSEEEEIEKLRDVAKSQQSKTDPASLDTNQMGHVYSTKMANDPIQKRRQVDGISVAVEWPKGSTRTYYSKSDPKKVNFEKLMKADYGYIPGTKDNDGEQLDVYVGPEPDSTKVFIIKQLKDDGSFDENKVMLGYPDKEAAKASYLDHMPPRRLGDVEETDLETFKKKHLQEAKNFEKTAENGSNGSCCTPCAQLRSAFMGDGLQKTASHSKSSELIKSIPAGPFTKDTLPRLERTERDIPNDILDLMAGLGIGPAASTPAMMGIVLKPREFQRVMLIRIGEKSLADDLDGKKMSFKPTKEIDDSVPVEPGLVNPRLKELLSLLGFMGDRSAASPSLRIRVIRMGGCALPAPSADVGPKPPADAEGVLKKIAAAYNGYRLNLIKKAASIRENLVSDPQLASNLFGSGMVKAFAGGIEKTGEASVLSPDSLAYLAGAFYTDRDFHTRSGVVQGSLAEVWA